MKGVQAAALILTTVALSLLGVAAASAQPERAPPYIEGPRYNQIDLSAEASREVPNDVVNAMLYVEVSDPSAAAVAAQVTRVANDALRTAQAAPGVRARSGGMSTAPVYTSGASGASGRIAGWRGRSELRLESRDLHAISELIGKLQSTMSVGYISFAVSPEVRKQVENELIGQAIQGFKARADVVRASIGGKTIRIRHMTVNTGMSGGPRPYFGPAAARAASVEPPQFEAGASQVQVNVTGTVEID